MSQAKLVQLSLIFENVESYSISVLAVEDLQLGDLTICWSPDDEGSLKSTYYANRVSLLLNAAKLKLISANQYDDGGDDLLSRIIVENDLVALGLVYSNGDEKLVNVAWGRYDDAVNTAMRVDSEPSASGRQRGLRIRVRNDLDRDIFGFDLDDDDGDESEDKYQAELIKRARQWKQDINRLLTIFGEPEVDWPIKDDEEEDE